MWILIISLIWFHCAGNSISNTDATYTMIKFCDAVLRLSANQLKGCVALQTLKSYYMHASKDDCVAKNRTHINIV